MQNPIVQTILEDCRSGRAVLPGVRAAQEELLKHEQELLDETRDFREILREVGLKFEEQWAKIIEEKGQENPEVQYYLDAMNYLRWE